MVYSPCVDRSVKIIRKDGVSVVDDSVRRFFCFWVEFRLPE